MEIQINKCGMESPSGELSLSLEIQGSVDELKEKLPAEIRDLILSKMWCKSWSELGDRVKTWIATESET